MGHHQFHLIDHYEILPLPRPVRVRVLVVADDAVSFTSPFGIGMAIDTLREQSYGFVRFEVTLARREGPAAENAGAVDRQPRYTGFRFDRLEPDGTPTLHGYDQVWCFGFAPGNSGSPDDGLIDAPAANPVSAAELAVLARWMDERRGGVFATGDHHFLGASMCARIPRVGTMRRWTNAQGVPPIGGLDRIDTNRPATPGQADIAGGNPDVMPDSVQEDHVPQRIDWKRYYSRLTHWRFGTSPHQLLCDGQRGVIDVMPDHPHEGQVIADDDVVTTNTFDFAGYVCEEYPTGAGGARPLPEVIAWGTTLPDPPYRFAKGDSPAKRFPMIGVYDGDGADVGRVVVDSTWHHWMDMNLEGLAAGAPDDYAKIQTYFRNIGVWLATPAQRRRMAVVASWWTFFTVEGVEELGALRPVFELGQSARDILGRYASRCLVREWVRPFLPMELVEKEWLPRWPKPDPCLSCPPFELVESMVLGGVIQALAPYVERAQQAQWQDGKAEAPSVKELEAVFAEGARAGVQALAELAREGEQRAGALAEALSRGDARPVKEVVPE